MSAGIMAVDEQKLRRSLHDRLESALGADEAALLMDYLPAVGWADVARREDLDHLAVLTRRDLEVFATELRGEMGELRSDLRGEMGELRSDLRGEMGELRSELRGEMGELRSELRTSIAELKSSLLMWMVPTVIGSIGISVTLARFTA